ncbi:MAG: hypothetical protein KAI66_07120 [Lentisphaeria bacterium]|nr:hypothetical protein [Lentisphaeria bacterium]
MIWIRDTIYMAWTTLCSIVAFFAEKTAESGIEANPLILVGITVLLSVWLVSGTWAASIAGSRQRSVVFHFFLGMLFPFVYPLVAIFVLDVRGAGQRAKVLHEEQEAEAEAARLMDSQQADAQGAEDAPDQFDRDYFKRIARDADGLPTGPWLVSFNGQEMKALQIVDTLDEVVVLEIGGDDGETQRIRVRYALVESCRAG